MVLKNLKERDVACVKHLFRKEQMFTVPNLLTLVRLFLIPVIIYLYCVKGDYIAAAATVLLSGATDVADGIIARKWNQISDLGKIIDPIADKLTQATMLYCLVTRYALMVPMFVLFVLKEMTMGLCGLMAIKQEHKVNSSQWFGKLNTVTLYVSMMILFLFPRIGDVCGNGLIILCAATTILALEKYLKFYKGVFSAAGKEKAVC